MEGKIKYTFVGKMWKYNSTGGWYFVSLPKKMGKEIRENLKWQEEGWGRMKVLAECNEISWETAIWFDTKIQTYLLPIKAEIRRKCKLKIDTNVDLVVWI